MHIFRGFLLVIIAALAVSGCDIFKADKEKLPGERISVLALQKPVEPDLALTSLDVALPRPAPNKDWPQSGGVPSHSMGHPSLPDELAVKWQAEIGEGASRFAQLLAGPVVVDGVLYAMDAKSLVTALDAGTGKKLWETDITPEDNDNQAWGGGIAFDGGRVFVTSGYGQILALDAKDGKVKWRVSVGSPLRGAPTVAEGRLFIITVDNQLQALSTEDGHRLWSYDSIPEPAEIAGSASPAIEGNAVIATFSSGEVTALRVENGRVIWSDSLSATRRFDAISTLADIRGRPVVDRGRVYVVSHAGRMAAIDLRSGNRVWEQDVGGIYAPWVAGDFVYVLSTSNELLCLTRAEGRVRWITQLDSWENMKDKEDPLHWAGPILAGDRLIAVASNGQVWSISPYTGAVLGHIELSAGSFLPPIVADNTLYLMTNDADLMALR
ncbi:MAG: PQQ-binding-like beta-propeller repeat protein [Aliidongia sp.]